METIINGRKVEFEESLPGCISFENLVKLSGVTNPVSIDHVFRGKTISLPTYMDKSIEIQIFPDSIFYVTASTPGIKYDKYLQQIGDTNYCYVVPGSHFWTDLTQLLEYLKHEKIIDREYLVKGVQNTLELGYNLKKKKQKVDYETIYHEGVKAFNFNYDPENLKLAKFRLNPYEGSPKKSKAWCNGYIAAASNFKKQTI